jgi:hypothetical protein
MYRPRIKTFKVFLKTKSFIGLPLEVELIFEKKSKPSFKVDASLAKTFDESFRFFLSNHQK